MGSNGGGLKPRPRRVRFVSLLSFFLLVACLFTYTRAHMQQNQQQQNHYKILGLRRDASTAEVRSAYKRLAMLYHPDRRQDDPNAAEKFSRISEAHETLKDKASRREYDQISSSSGGSSGAGGRRGDNFHSQGHQQHHRSGYYTYASRNGRTYYQFHPNAQRSNQYNNSQQFDEHSLVLILLLVGFAYVLGTMLNTETEDKESEQTESSKNRKDGTGKVSSDMGGAEKPSLLALLSRRTTMLHRLSDWQVSPLKQTTPVVGSKPYVVLIGVRVVGGTGADKLVREAVGTALSGCSSGNNGEFARERLAQLGLEQAASAWAEIDALARKFATDPVCFRFLGPGTDTNDRAALTGGKAAAATQRYLAWLVRLFGIGDPVSAEVLQRVRASMALTNSNRNSNNIPNQVLNSGGCIAGSDNSKVGVCVDGIWIVHLRRVKVRLFSPLAAEFPTTLERVGQFAKKGVLEKWITKVFDGQLLVPDVSGVQDKNMYWPLTP